MLKPVLTVPDGGDALNPTTTFPAREDLNIGWSQGAPGTTIAGSIETSSISDGVVQALQCLFDASASEGTLPLSTIVPPFPLADGVKVFGQISVAPFATTQLTAGNAGGSASDPDAWTLYADVSGGGVSGHFTSTD